MSGGVKRRWDAAPSAASSEPPTPPPKASVAKLQAQLAEKGLKFAMKVRQMGDNTENVLLNLLTLV